MEFDPRGVGDMRDAEEGHPVGTYGREQETKTASCSGHLLKSIAWFLQTRGMDRVAGLHTITIAT